MKPCVALLSVAPDELVSCNPLLQNSNTLLGFYILLVLSLWF